MKKLLKKHKISLVIEPPECTSRVQVVQVLINKTFKDEVRTFYLKITWMKTSINMLMVR